MGVVTVTYLLSMAEITSGLSFEPNNLTVTHTPTLTPLQGDSAKTSSLTPRLPSSVWWESGNETTETSSLTLIP